MRLLAIAATATAFTATTAHADLDVRFIEGAPKDRFVISSATGLCADEAAAITVDLGPSAGKLIFDVTDAGAGVEVFQPFELVTGGEQVIEAPEVADGDTRVTLLVSDLAPGAEVAFTIDVDDTINAREITVSRSEITGAMAMLAVGGVEVTGTFDESARAKVPWSGCS